MFIHSFWRRLIQTKMERQSVTKSTTVEKCLAGAYRETLMEHHGLVVRSVFSVSHESHFKSSKHVQKSQTITIIFQVAVKRSPTRSVLLTRLGLPEEVLESPTRCRDEQSFLRVKIIPEMSRYLGPLELCLTVLLTFLREKELLQHASS